MTITETNKIMENRKEFLNYAVFVHKNKKWTWIVGQMRLLRVTQWSSNIRWTSAPWKTRLETISKTLLQNSRWGHFPTQRDLGCWIFTYLRILYNVRRSVSALTLKSFLAHRRTLNWCVTMPWCTTDQRLSITRLPKNCSIQDSRWWAR